MVAIDEEFDCLKAAEKAGWSTIPDQHNITPAHTAAILREHFRELARADDTAKRPEDYRAKLAASEKATEQFRVLLRHNKTDAAVRDAAIKSLSRTCVACHKQHRN
jgi:hypothetical protein